MNPQLYPEPGLFQLPFAHDLRQGDIGVGFIDFRD
jgi:hypothetical protein